MLAAEPTCRAQGWSLDRTIGTGSIMSYPSLFSYMTQTQRSS